MQVLFLGTVALLVGSLATVAVPKLAGELIDVCITYGKEGSSGDEAKDVLNKKLFQIIGILAVGGIATGIRTWCVFHLKNCQLCAVRNGHFHVFNLPRCILRRLFNASAEKVMWRLRNNLFTHIILQEVGFFDRVRTGELMNRLSEVSLHHALMKLAHECQRVRNIACLDFP